jgi:protein-tyrosine phosphatase
MTKVLFVCSGNVFRSLSAERALRSLLPPGSEIEVSSAGTIAGKAKLRQDVLDALGRWGVDARDHKPRLLTQEIVDESDLIVAMNTDHQKIIAEQFGRHAPLYNEIAVGTALPFPDLPDVVEHYWKKPEESRAFVDASVDRIFRNRENFLARLPQYLPKAPSAQK